MATDEDRRARKVRETKARAVLAAAIAAAFRSHGMADPPHGWKNFLDAVDARLLDAGVDSDGLDAALSEGDEALIGRLTAR